MFILFHCLKIITSIEGQCKEYHIMYRTCTTNRTNTPVSTNVLPHGTTVHVDVMTKSVQRVIDVMFVYIRFFLFCSCFA